MGLLNKIFGRRIPEVAIRIDQADAPRRQRRRPQIERCEPRQMLAADVLLGSVYFEEATGDDTAADLVQVTFEGGAAGTTLERLTIDGDKTGDGPSAGDVFWDIEAGGLGAFGHVGLTIESHVGFEILGVTLVDGGSQIVFDFRGFEAGETLEFSLDADEIQFHADPGNTNPAPGDVDTNSLVEGAEFQRSIMRGEFFAPQFENLTLQASYWDQFDQRFQDAETAANDDLDLPNDRYADQRDLSDRTAGAVTHAPQVELPTIAGTVFHDRDLDNTQDAEDQGIANVELALWQWVAADNNYVDTGLRTQTDGQGDYQFVDTGGEDGASRLLPGTYQVREAQPTGYFSVGAAAGTIDGATVGQVTSDDVISEITLPAAKHSVDNDFAEALPAAISGYVYADDNNDGVFQQGSEAPLPNVEVRLTPVDVLDGSTTPIVISTDANGFYAFDGLMPGEYRVDELATPAGFLDGLDAAGTVGGTQVGQAINPGDSIIDIFLGGGDEGIHYDFGEIRLGSISGRVHLSTDGDCDFDAPDVLLGGVRVDLLDAAGSLIASTTTDDDGTYEFHDVAPGEYQLREHTPATHDGTPIFDGDEHLGTAGGQIIANDHIGGIVLTPGQTATGYDFCEHVGATLSGWVYHDESNDGIRDANEQGIGGATLELLDADGNPTGRTTTTADGGNVGYYEFTDLAPGKWGVREVQPGGYVDGLDTAGTHGGVAENPGDKLTGAMLDHADVGQEYNFGELLAATLGGRVHASSTGDCEFDNPEVLLAGVQIDLLDTTGQVVQTTTTDANGEYRFDGLAPGTYQVVEHQPTEHDGRRLFDGDEHVGSAGGEILDNDSVSGITLASGQSALDYHFCEHFGVMLSGWVYHDQDNDGIKDSGEEGIGGVVVELLDENMNPTGQTATTSQTGNEQGFYKFNDLPPGTYGVRELQPEGWLDGIDTPGDRGGQAEPSPPGDKIHGIDLAFGHHGSDYNFGEILPGSISGQVHVSTDPFCIPSDSDERLSGVQIELLDPSGAVLQTTVTDASGNYTFTNLRPGTYSVRETQPEGYFDGTAHTGNGGGTSLTSNELADIAIGSGEALIDYDFCEKPAATLSGYVFQDGPAILTVDPLPEDISSIRDGQRTPDDRPLAGVVVELRHGETGRAILGREALPGLYADDEPIYTVTDANGHYIFDGLAAGIYSVVEAQPAGLIDGIDTQGSTGGVAVNPPVLKTAGNLNNGFGGSIENQFRAMFGNDAIAAIPLEAGQHSVENNFSEVATQTPFVPPVERPPLPAPPVFGPNTIPFSPAPFLPLVRPPVLPTLRLFAGSGSLPSQTWHLSVVNAGFPRSVEFADSAPMAETHRFQVSTWQGPDLEQGTWRFWGSQPSDFVSSDDTKFGHPEGIPVAGDWDGDGTTDIGIYLDGEWYLDANGNRVWDEGDLWAKLGTKVDTPITGDWDGDGKTDIGIFGPEWPGDPRQLAHEPGLPDPENRPFGKAKNMPPDEEHATDGHRVLKRSAEGEVRTDLIDHVFRYGSDDEIPVAGDWNGDGVATIGVFANGTWRLDVDGDGRFTNRDRVVHFGDPGETPVVGDFNADGIDELGTFNNGMWILDINHNGVADLPEEAFKHGGQGDRPIPGDFDGDGTDEPATYQAAEPLRDAA